MTIVGSSDTSSNRPIIICEWYAFCDHVAAGVVVHPVLGEVPCCERCADKHDLDLQPFGPMT